MLEIPISKGDPTERNILLLTASIIIRRNGVTNHFLNKLKESPVNQSITVPYRV
jgi:hypothetical protein